MALKRQLWKPPFADFPSWPCPACEFGTLALMEGSLTIVETGRSEESKRHDAWEPTWKDERFIAMLVCNNVNCKESVAACGRTRHVDDHDYERQELNWARLFQPTFLAEAPPVFPIPEHCPHEIKRELMQAFSVMWSDVGLSANRLRSAIEALLDQQKIQKTTVQSSGRRVRLTLHRRIGVFRNKNADAARSLEAVKWLGNVGSHASLDALTIDDLLDGFELFEHAIDRVYIRREEQLRKLAKVINKQKGKRRHSR